MLWAVAEPFVGDYEVIYCLRKYLMPRAHVFGEFFAVTHGDAKSEAQEVTPPEFEGERENYSYFISAEKMSPKGLILEVIHLSLYVSSLTGKHPEKNILHFTRNFVETGFLLLGVWWWHLFSGFSREILNKI